MHDLTRQTLDELATLTRQSCPDCAGTSQVEGAVCYCVERFERRLADAEFPERLRAKTLADLDWSRIVPDKSRDLLQRYIRELPTALEQGVGLGLIGPVGCGKTHTLIGCAQVAAALGYSVWFVNVPDLFGWLRQSYDATARRTYSSWEMTNNRQARRQHEALVLEDLIDVEVLILDDLGAERPTDWARERLYRVVNQRWQQQRPTWLTSNEALDRLAETMGERTVSRLKGDALLLTLDGADYRQIEKNRRVTTLLTPSAASRS